MGCPPHVAAWPAGVFTCLPIAGLYLSTAPGLNVTVMFSSGAGVEVQKSGQLLQLAVLLPEKFSHRTRGLFGVMNDNAGDDLAFRNGTVLGGGGGSSPEELFAFGADCKWPLPIFLPRKKRACRRELQRKEHFGPYLYALLRPPPAILRGGTLPQSRWKGSKQDLP